MNRKFRPLVKTLLTSVILVVTLVTAIVSSLSILKDEAVKTHMEVAKLHANALSEQVTQTFNNINLLSSGLITLLEQHKNFDLLENKFKEVLFNSPYIRSINILNEDALIIYSSNNKNSTLQVNLDEFYPTPMFDKSILRFGTPYIGRDLAETLTNSKIVSSENSKQSFIPVLKHFSIKDRKYYILLSINSDYFYNRYASNLKNEFEYMDLIRIDGTLLFSSNQQSKVGNQVDGFLFDESLENSLSWGVENINDRVFITAYYLSDLYPINICIRMDLKSALSAWESKSSNISLLVSSLLIISALLVVLLLFKYHTEKEKELKAQRKQLKHQKKFQLLFEHGLFLVAILKEDGKIIDINHVGQNLLNEDINNLIAKDFWDLSCFSQTNRVWLKKVIKEYQKGDIINTELVIEDYKKQALNIEFSLMPIEIDGELELVALGLDITQRKQKEEELKQAYTVFQNTHDGIMITDENTNIINVNSAFVKSTGYSLEAIYNKTPKLLQSGKHSSEFYTSMWQSISETGLWEGELINKRKSGELFNEYITISAVYDEKGLIKNYIGIFADTTKQKEQEKRLKDQEKMLSQQSKMAAMGEMIENIAHQWRQPLSVISTISTGMIFKKGIDLDDKEDEIKELEKINETTQYLSQTIEDFRDFLKTDKPRMMFDLENTLNKSLKLISSKLKNREIDIIQNVEDVHLYGIENELIQVLLNLFNNSRDILEEQNMQNKVIMIELSKDDKNAILKIKDNGGGIDESIIDRVFEPYFTTKHKSQGTGIGLYMTEEIIVNHMNGEISCYNEQFEYKDNIYKGACFELILPIDE